MKVEEKKANLQRKVHTYTKRMLSGTLTKGGYTKLRSARKSIKIIERGQLLAEDLAFAIAEHLGEKISSNALLTKNQQDSSVRLAIQVYAKFGLENRIPVRFLAWYIGKPLTCIYDARKQLSSSFTTNKENLIKWKRFCESYKVRLK